MIVLRSFQEIFKRDRRPGDLVFAVVFLGVALFLLANLDAQVIWAERTKFAAQPALWPTIAVAGMVLFGTLHLLGSALSPRIYGRWAEVTFWLKSFEYVAWFLAYVLAVPRIGYLPGTLVFCGALTWRLGYRSPRMIGAALATGLGIVLIFKTFLHVNLPGGMIYEYLPSGLRSFMLINF